MTQGKDSSVSRLWPSFWPGVTAKSGSISFETRAQKQFLFFTGYGQESCTDLNQQRVTTGLI